MIEADGMEALRAPARQGRPPKLTPLQLRQLQRALLKGGWGHGLEEELWTLRRVAEVIWRRAGVGYHPGHVWRILRGLGWSVQRPVRVAAERDEQAIARWIVEGTGRRSSNRPYAQRLAVLPGRVGSFADPPLRRTWAPRGVTPVLGDRQRHRPKVSMVAMLCYRPDGSAARLGFGFHRGSYDTATLVKVLTGLHAFLGGAPVNLIWDNRNAHKSTAMREFLADQDWLPVDYLPA